MSDIREAERGLQCINRRNGCCDLVNARLGWKHGMPLKDCDRCWNAGADTDQGVAIREGIFRDYLAFAKRNAMRSGNVTVIKALLRDHLTDIEKERILSDPEYRWIRTQKERWAKVADSWDMAESFLKAVTSRGFTGKRVDLTVKGIRKLSCFGSEQEGVSPCGAVRTSASGRRFCGECGCGERTMAMLDPPPDQPEAYTKLDFPYLECARGRPGFSNEGAFDAEGNARPDPER